MVASHREVNEPHPGPTGGTIIVGREIVRVPAHDRVALDGSAGKSLLQRGQSIPEGIHIQAVGAVRCNIVGEDEPRMGAVHKAEGSVRSNGIMVDRDAFRSPTVSGHELESPSVSGAPTR